jgi:hypothetical protein
MFSWPCFPLSMVNRNENTFATCPEFKLADKLIADRGGDLRAVIIELVAIVDELKRENEKLVASVSRGFARSDFLRWP